MIESASRSRALRLPLFVLACLVALPPIGTLRGEDGRPTPPDYWPSDREKLRAEVDRQIADLLDEITAIAGRGRKVPQKLYDQMDELVARQEALAEPRLYLPPHTDEPPSAPNPPPVLDIKSASGAASRSETRR